MTEVETSLRPKLKRSSGSKASFTGGGGGRRRSLKDSSSIAASSSSSSRRRSLVDMEAASKISFSRKSRNKDPPFNKDNDDDDDDLQSSPPMSSLLEVSRNFRESFSARTAPTTQGDSNTSFDCSGDEQHNTNQLQQQQQQQQHITHPTMSMNDKDDDDDMPTIHSLSGGSSRSYMTTMTSPLGALESSPAAGERKANKQHHCNNNSDSDDENDTDSNNANDDDTTTTNNKTRGMFGASKLQVHRFRETCGHWVNNERVQVTIIILIVLNALMMGLGTFDFVQDNPNVNKAFEATDKTFLVIFTIELAMQLIYHDVRLFLDGWLLFDFIVVLVSWSMDSLQIVRAFRIFRAFRLITRLDVLRNLVLALFEVAPSMMAIIALLLLILYIYAVMCTVLFRDVVFADNENYFGSLDQTLFTLFQMMTLEWADIVRDVMNEHYWAWAVFGPFLVMTSFILYSLIIAVVCDAVAVTEHSQDEQQELLQQEELQQQVLRLEERLHEMTHHQQVLLQALQQALLQVDLQQEEKLQQQQQRRQQQFQVVAPNGTTTTTAQQDENGSQDKHWKWSGEVQRPSMMADTLMMRLEYRNTLSTPESVVGPNSDNDDNDDDNDDSNDGH